jgi:hypothetical protein
LALRHVWAGSGRSRLWVLAGWLLLTSAVLGWAWGRGADKAVALALLMPSPLAYAVVASGADLRRRRNSRRRDGPNLIARASAEVRFRRAAARFLLAGPLSGAAATAVGTALALNPSWDEANRIVAAGLLVPAVWAAAMCWSLSDRRIGRIALGLAAITAAAASAAIL